MYDWIEESLTTIRRADWYRAVQTLEGLPGAVVQLDRQTVINFASNDYLGLAGDERLIEAAVQATRLYGTGSTGSRLLSGHRPIHRQLEQALARFKQTEDAIVFSSGYLANLGTISALVGKRDLILSDRLNHSSLKNGAILSGATVIEYAHCNLADLKANLSEHRANYRRCLILTDSVFSMDGDICPLPELLDLGDEFQSMVLVDEAHGTGVLGDTGSGCVEYFGLRDRPLIQIGTLSKALGSLGGYVAGSAKLTDYLRNRAATWIYTTGLSPADAAAALAAIEIVQQELQRRQALWQNVNTLKTRLNTQLPHLKLFPSDSAILCFQLPNAATALDIAQSLKEVGIFAPAIRPPTVQTSRIRLSLMATHTQQHLEQLIEVLQNLIPAD